MGVWLKNGASAHKILLGVPLFARSFRLARAEHNSIRSPTIGNGIEGPFTRSAGFLSYFEVKHTRRNPLHCLSLPFLSRFVCYKLIPNGKNVLFSMVPNRSTCSKIVNGLPMKH